MTAIDSIAASKKTKQRQQLRSGGVTQIRSSGQGSFQDHVQELLGNKGKKVLSEEDLFAGSINHRLHSKKGSKAAEVYRSKLQEQLADGESLEDAANKALKKTRVEGLLTNKEAHKIRQESFQASQIDNNAFRLYTGEGARVAKMDSTDAFEMVQKRFSAIDDGSLLVQTKGERMAAFRAAKAAGTYEANVDKSAQGQSINLKGVEKGNTSDGLSGFLYKPESDHGGSLVILMSNDLKGDVSSVSLKDQKGKLIESGRSTGYANGDREHFRFNQSGGNYPNNLTVEVVLNSGKKIHYNIKDSSQRYD
ncbi:MAG: hypothetical protein KDD62_14690 [Bdellovibrionales bacterium]|nr:hypothetical protein [Bdellovibrionales bacterium]